MCHSSLSSHGPFISPAPFNVRPVSALHDLPPSSLLRWAGGRPVSRHEVWRDFFYSSVFYKSKFFIDFDFYFCKISSWTTGKAGNTAPRGQVPTPTRRTYRLSGREALSNRGVGAKEAPPQARTRLTRAGIQTAGKTAADRPQRDGGRIKQGEERCGRRWVFSQAHNKTGSIKLVQISHRRAAMGGGNEG